MILNLPDYLKKICSTPKTMLDDRGGLDASGKTSIKATRALTTAKQDIRGGGFAGEAK